MTLGAAIGLFSVVAYGLLVIAAYCLPETKGKELDPGKAMSANLQLRAN
jgi:hypothetical protein